MENTISFLKKYLINMRLKIMLLALVLITSVSIQLILPQILGDFIDAVIVKDSNQQLINIAMIYIGLSIILQMIKIVYTYISQNIGWTATNELRENLIEHCVNLDMTFHKSQQVGQLVERIDGDIAVLFNFFSKFTLELLTNIVLLIGVILLLFLKDWRIGISLLIFSAVAMIIVWKVQERSSDTWVKDRKENAEFYGFLSEQITGIEDIHTCGAKEYVMKQFYSSIRTLLSIRLKAVMKGNNMWIVTYITFGIGNVMALGMAAYLWGKSAISIGTVYIIFSYTQLLKDPIEKIRTQLQDLQKSSSSIIRIQELFQIKPQMQGGEDCLDCNGGISVEFKKVCFEYEEGVPILKDISFKIEKTKIIGILGRTGSGKSTLVQLITRLYNKTSGEIYLNGKEINSYNIKEIRENIAYVTQDVQLFHASIRDNLTLFNKDVKDENIIEVLYDIGLKDWYNRYPDGLDTILDKGEGLSAGEAQLIALARAFIRKSKLIILDEASSKLDPITENIIENALDKLLKNKTCIIIAHHLNTINRADHILILEKGEIVEYGLREKLSCDEQSKLYALLVNKMGEEMVC